MVLVMVNNVVLREVCVDALICFVGGAASVLELISAASVPALSITSDPDTFQLIHLLMVV